MDSVPDMDDLLNELETNILPLQRDPQHYSSPPCHGAKRTSEKLPFDGEASEKLTFDGEASEKLQCDAETSEKLTFDGETSENLQCDAETSEKLMFDGEASENLQCDAETSEKLMFDGEVSEKLTFDEEASEKLTFDGEASEKLPFGGEASEKLQCNAETREQSENTAKELSKCEIVEEDESECLGIEDVLDEIISCLSRSNDDNSPIMSVRMDDIGSLMCGDAMVKGEAEKGNDGKGNEKKVGFMRCQPDHPDVYSNFILKRCNGDETNFGKLGAEVADEMDRIAERYAEMEQYLASYDTDNTSADPLEQQSLLPDTEDFLKPSDVQAMESEEINVERRDTKSVDYEADSEGGLRLACESEAVDVEEQSDEILESVTKDAAAELDASSHIISIPNSVHELSCSIPVYAGDAVNMLENVELCINDCAASVERPLSLCCRPKSSTVDGEETSGDDNEKSKDENAAEKQIINGDERVEAKIIENDNDDSAADCETAMLEVEEARAVSVVSSTYDMSRDSGVKYLTESERQLGKQKPVWIADKETLSCMICCLKFTVFTRRHHCRCCGRVLCAQCTTQKASLPYANDPNREHRVCDPCFETLKRIETYEKNMNSCETTKTNECRPSSDGGGLEGFRTAKPVLKSKNKSDVSTAGANDGQGPSSSGDAAHGVTVKRSVTFRDGLHPGDSPIDETEVLTAGTSSSKPRRHGSKRQHVSRRLQQLHLTEESVCLLPDTSSDNRETSVTDDRNGAAENNCLYRRSCDGTVTGCDNIQQLIVSLHNFEPVEVMIFRNLWCTVRLCEYENKTVMCITSKGMSFVGLDEIFLAYYCDLECTELPIDYLWRIYEIYQNALTPQNESSDEQLGIRPAHIRVPPLNQTTRFSNSEKPVARDILLFRPSVQNFGSLLVPSTPFLVAAFIHQSESIWANVIPQRLLFRIGLQASFYPTPVVNDFGRKPVYNSIFDSSVLKMFNDFRNWRFRMPLIAGSTLTIRNNNECELIIPTWAMGEIVKLISANKNMIAWGLDFSADADSYLVCEQNDAGCFDSQIFTNGVGNRKITGASFVVIDGALKGGNEPFAVSVLEDGVAVRLQSSVMESLGEAFLAGQDFEQSSSSMKFSVIWKDPFARQFVGELISPIDSRSLTGCFEYGLKKSRILGSFYPIPSQTDWSLRLVSVYNVEKGRFAQRAQSKVFGVSEQVAGQIALTLAPFVGALIEHDLRHIFFRIRVTTEDAEYKTIPWPNMEKEFATWSDLLNNQVVPGLFTVCSYITAGFHAELHMVLISVQTNP